MPKKKTTKIKEKPVDQLINFSFKEPTAKLVHLVGSFNNWSTVATPMKKKQDTWTINMLLTPGTHEYRFFVDGKWQNDPNRTELKDNPFGSQNNVVEV